jgi:hypothetical protein
LGVEALTLGFSFGASKIAGEKMFETGLKITGKEVYKEIGK